MIRSTILISAVENFIREHNISTDTLSSTKIREILLKIAGSYRAENIFDDPREYYTIIEYFAKKHNFGYRKKKLQNYQEKEIFQNITQEKLKLTWNISLDPSETIIVYDKVGPTVKLLLNGQKIEMAKEQWKKLRYQKALRFVDVMKTTEVTI